MPDEMQNPFPPAVPPTVSQEVVSQGDFDTADQKVERRSTVESDYNGQRHAREMKYIDDKNRLESDYRYDLNEIRKAKEAALNEVGLNHDGSDPQARQQGLAALID